MINQEEVDNFVFNLKKFVDKINELGFEKKNCVIIFYTTSTQKDIKLPTRISGVPLNFLNNDKIENICSFYKF
jgi:hypothetical protein